eukprot:1109777-Prorocentrum_minimum.AAC.3
MFPSAYNTIAYAASITSGSDIITCRIRKLQPLTVSPTYVGQIGRHSPEEPDASDHLLVFEGSISSRAWVSGLGSGLPRYARPPRFPQTGVVNENNWESGLGG